MQRRCCHLQFVIFLMFTSCFPALQNPRSLDPSGQCKEAKPQHSVTSANCSDKVCKLLYRQGFIPVRTWPVCNFFLLFALLLVHKWSPSPHCFSIHNLISCVLLLVVNTKWENRFELLHAGNMLAMCSSVLGQCLHDTGRMQRPKCSRTRHYSESNKF